MLLTPDQIVELKKIYPDPEYIEEGGLPYVLLRDFLLPEGTSPARTDVLLCPRGRDGYESRLFFSSQVTRSPSARSQTHLNWNTEARIAERSWFAYSWKLGISPRSLPQMLAMHVRALQ